MSRKNKRFTVETPAGNDMMGWMNKGYRLEGLDSWGNFVAIRSNGSAAVLATDTLTGDLVPVTSWAPDKDAAVQEFNQTSDTFIL